MALDLPTRICAWEKCGQPFSPKREKQKYCRPQCRVAAYNASRTIPDTCPHCGGSLKEV